jgi:hypothetical protein
MQHDKSIKKEIDNPLEVKLRIDRIILYIDDLDRCNEDIVLNVLEAIHLLLAFPLFVVVVGVDPRWLNNALNEKYKLLFGNNNGAAQQHELLDGNVATSYDYLEKIFQIPFYLKPINETGRNKLIAYLIEKEMADNRKKEESLLPTVNKGSSTASPSVKAAIEKENNPENNLNENLISATSEPDENDAKHRESEIRIAILTDKLFFSKDELDFMQKISAMYASSPRTINRFINIYRIIKSHQSIDVTDPYSKDDFAPILIMLSIVVGYSSIAHSFNEQLKRAPAEQSFKDFINEEGVDKKIQEKLPLCLNEEVLSIPAKRFQKNLELISRFSFRTLID